MAAYFLGKASPARCSRWTSTGTDPWRDLYGSPSPAAACLTAAPRRCTLRAPVPCGPPPPGGTCPIPPPAGKTARRCPPRIRLTAEPRRAILWTPGAGGLWPAPGPGARDPGPAFPGPDRGRPDPGSGVFPGGAGPGIYSPSLYAAGSGPAPEPDAAGDTHDKKKRYKESITMNMIQNARTRCWT